MPHAVIGRSVHRKGFGAFVSVLALTLSAASHSPRASSTQAISAPTLVPAALHATLTVNALLLGQEYSLFYGGFDY